jgi:adenylate cyclase
MGNKERAARPFSRRIERKLAAMLSADVTAYSRLMGEDEEATLHTLTSHRKQMDALIAQHRGRIVGTAGDSVLAEFASVVDAVQCAVVIQITLQAENAQLPPERRMEFRMGINLGDVMVEGEQIYGDGVNVAARVQALADPGGVFISGTVHEQIENKLSLHYEDLGEQEVKNIAKPVRVWRVVMDEAAAALAEQVVLQQAQAERVEAESAVGAEQALPKRRRVGRGVFVFVLVSVFVLGGSVAVRYLLPSIPNTQHPTPTPSPSPHTLHPTPYTQSEPALPLPDKPSLLVLPLKNMSSDPEQEYFSDGLTEELTASLSRLSGLFVISRNSAFFYKGKAVKMPDLSKELGVKYVLEGSVRKDGDQVRIIMQLIDAPTDHYLWSERYDRPLKDIFALQDEIVQQIVTTLKLQLTLWEQGILVRKTTGNLEAYDYYLRGMADFLRLTKEANTQAQQMLEKALALDPNYAQAYASLSTVYWLRRWYQWSPDPQNLERAFELARKAVELDDAQPTAHWTLGYVYLMKRQHEQAIAEAERTIALDPNNANAYVQLGDLLVFVGRAQETIGLVEKAMRLNPHYPATYANALGWGYLATGRYEEAIAPLKEAIRRMPNFAPAHWNLTGVYSELGREAEARAEATEILRISPNFSVEVLRQMAPLKDPAVLERYISALRKAGLK